MKRKTLVHTHKDVQNSIKSENQRLLQRLLEVKPQMTIEEPKKFDHLMKNKKRQQILEIKYTEIERENRILLEKLQKVISKKGQISPNKSMNQSQMSIDPEIAGMTQAVNQNNSAVVNPNGSQDYSISQIIMQQKRVLPHELQRKKFQEKITKENMQLLMRLQNKGSHYNIDKWEQEENKRQQILKQISILPPPVLEPISRNIQNSVEKRQSPTSKPFNTIQQNEARSHSQMNIRNSNILNKEQQPHFQYCDRKPTQLEVDRLVVYKKGQLINREYFILEMSYNTRGFFISLFSIENSEKSYVLELENPEKTNLILSAFNHDYDYMAQHVRIIKGKVKIMRPESQNQQIDLRQIYSSNQNPSRMVITAKRMLNQSINKNQDVFGQRSYTQDGRAGIGGIDQQNSNHYDSHKSLEKSSKTTRNSSYNNLLLQQKNRHHSSSTYGETEGQVNVNSSLGNAYQDLPSIEKTRFQTIQTSGNSQGGSGQKNQYKIPQLPVKKLSHVIKSRDGSNYDGKETNKTENPRKKPSDLRAKGISTQENYYNDNSGKLPKFKSQIQTQQNKNSGNIMQTCTSNFNPNQSEISGKPEIAHQTSMSKISNVDKNILNFIQEQEKMDDHDGVGGQLVQEEDQYEEEFASETYEEKK